MKTKIFIVVLALGLFSSSTISAQEKEKSKIHQEHVNKENYTCPMHPEVKSDKPGDCSKCGMELKKMDVKKEANKHCSMPKKGSCCPKKTDNPTTKNAKKSSCTRKKEKSKE